MFCKNCGSQLNQNSKFCGKCGTITSEEAKPSSHGLFTALIGNDVRFLPIWMRSTFILTIAMSALFGLLGSFQDEFWSVFTGILIMAALLAVLATFFILWRKRGFILEKSSTQSLSSAESAKLKGLGGWLVIVVLGLFVNAGFLLYTVYTDINLFSNGTVDEVSNPNFTNHIPGFNGFARFELIAAVLLGLTAIYLIYLFFKTRKEFPKYYIAFLISFLIYAIIEYVFVQGMPEQIKSLMPDTVNSENTALGQAAWGALIWGFYMVKSKKVKATFVN